MKENMTPTTTLLHGDCLEVMKDIPDGSVDLIVTDPPYRTISGGNKSKWASGYPNSVPFGITKQFNTRTNE